jgi:hypothetical protein
MRQMGNCVAAQRAAALLALAAPAGARTGVRSVAKADRVLLVGIAGMHEFDLARFGAAHPDSALAWLTDSGRTEAVRQALEARRRELGIRKIYGGNALSAEFGDPARCSRVPDLIIESESGIIYTKPTATKVAEHGGFTDDDRHVPLVVALPGGRARTATDRVETRAVAPSILRILRLDPRRLDATATGVRPLPQLGF